MTPFELNRDSSMTIRFGLDIEGKKLMMWAGSEEPLTMENVDVGTGLFVAISGNGTVGAKLNLGRKKFKHDIPEGFLPIECDLVPGWFLLYFSFCPPCLRGRWGITFCLEGWRLRVLLWHYTNLMQDPIFLSNNFSLLFFFPSSFLFLLPTFFIF